VKAVCDRGLTHILPVRCIEPLDVSDAILYLVSDTGHDTTGSPMVLDVGYSTWSGDLNRLIASCGPPAVMPRKAGYSMPHPSV
jgi:hypothetical protein